MDTPMTHPFFKPLPLITLLFCHKSPAMAFQTRSSCCASVRLRIIFFSVFCLIYPTVSNSNVIKKTVVLSPFCRLMPVGPPCCSCWTIFVISDRSIKKHRPVLCSIDQLAEIDFLICFYLFEKYE